MASRALIIAVEDYPLAQGGVATKLPGTLQAGLDFKAWLEGKWRADRRASGDTEIVFCSSPTQAGSSAANSVDVLESIYDLKERGRGMTEELYVFFSGHGFAFVDKPGHRADVLMSADFVNGKLSEASCFNLDMLIQWFRDHLGPGRHYYFIDACRNNLSGNDVAAPVELVWDKNTSPDASSFALQSTAPGAVSIVQGAFPKALIDGLKGKGRAKRWEDGVRDRMFVKYASLRSFVKNAAKGTQVTSKAAGEVSEDEAVLATLRPVPTHKCTIDIVGSTPSDEGHVVFTRNRAPVGQQQQFRKCPAPLILEADDYTVCVELEGACVTPSTAVPVDLYDDQTLRFTKGAAAPPAPPPGAPPDRGPGPEPPPDRGPGPTITRRVRPADTVGVDSAELNVIVPRGGRVTLQSFASGSAEVFEASKKVTALPGGYLATLTVNNADVERREFEVMPSESVPIDLSNWHDSVPHQSIANLLPVYDGAPDFSESLGGPVTDPDLVLWLALIGGGRILGSRGDYSKLSHFPLHDFMSEPPGASPTYVVGGFEDPTTQLEVSVSPGPIPIWQIASEPPNLPGIRETYSPSLRGPQLISLRVDGDASYTIASYAMENRATLVTVTLDDQGEFRLSQYLLPLGHLVELLPNAVKQRVEYRNHLEDVRYLARASRAFRKRRNLEKAARSDQLMELLYLKWLDPMGSALASYELIRRGKERDTMKQVLDNMQEYFTDFPDTAALARLGGRVAARPSGPPLFFDGLRAFEDFRIWLPLPASHLDFGGLWTAWRGAVK